MSERPPRCGLQLNWIGPVFFSVLAGAQSGACRLPFLLPRTDGPRRAADAQQRRGGGVVYPRVDECDCGTKQLNWISVEGGWNS